MASPRVDQENECEGFVHLCVCERDIGVLDASFTLYLLQLSEYNTKL